MSEPGLPTAGVGTGSKQSVAEQSVAAMLARDRASPRLGIEVVSIAPGRVSLRMLVREDMLNGHDVCHGGAIFALADTAFACACNSWGPATLAAGASIDFLQPARAGDNLVALAKELWRSGRTGIYDVMVSNQRGEQVALFRGRARTLGLKT
jgi:acyl-CoA thioesterase